MTIPLTPIAQLATYYPTNFTLTILGEELNGFGNTELIVEIEAAYSDTAQYRINKPVGKRWREANPQIGIKYSAEIEFYAPANKHFISIISEADTTATSTVDYVTSYIDLPYTDSTVVACHIWDLNVEFPSMLIRARQSDTIYRVAVPSNLVNRRHEIHNRYITINVKKHNIRGTFQLLSIDNILPVLQVQQLEAYKPIVAKAIQPIEIEATTTITAAPRPLVEIGSKWTHNKHTLQVTVQAISSSPYGEVIWVSDNNSKQIVVPNCMLIQILLSNYTLVQEVIPTKFIWDIHLIPSDGILCRHVVTGKIDVLNKFSNLEDFIPLTKLEAMNLVYDFDEIPY